ncbi:hypothetical protein [Flagellimonas oceanensis]|uniref:hypothetical protein n=1 Tax=Flagellimonas oceanensis TaxID=2499163 RepID=UPI0026BC7848|tara:strand:+ start:25 stop:231 length:207 start_codon:yes stop_codon:yes gene_type:complete
MYDPNYDKFQRFFSYLKEKEILTLEESVDLLTEYLQNGTVTFNTLPEGKSKDAKELLRQYANGELKID